MKPLCLARPILTLIEARPESGQGYLADPRLLHCHTLHRLDHESLGSGTFWQ